jgi:hypothetical protein
MKNVNGCHHFKLVKQSIDSYSFSRVWVDATISPYRKLRPQLLHFRCERYRSTLKERVKSVNGCSMDDCTISASIFLKTIFLCKEKQNIERMNQQTVANIMSWIPPVPYLTCQRVSNSISMSFQLLQIQKNVTTMERDSIIHGEALLWRKNNDELLRENENL